MQQPAASSPNPPASPPCEGGRKSGRKLARWNALLTKHYPHLDHRLLAFVRSRVSSDPTGEDLVQELYVRGRRSCRTACSTIRTRNGSSPIYVAA